MKRISLILAFALLAALPLHAADRAFDLTGWASWVDPNSSGTFNASNANQPFDVSFDGKLGYGLGANIFLGDRVSLSLDASAVETQGTFRSRAVGPMGGTSSTGNVKMIPITAVLQYHFAPQGFIDPYVGAGAAYVLFDKASKISDIGGLGVRQLDLKDDAGLAVNAGLGFRVTPRFAITLDGKYVPLKSSATAVFAVGPNANTKINVNPVIFSAGATLRF